MLKFLSDLWSAIMALIQVGRDIPEIGSSSPQPAPPPSAGPPLTQGDWSNGPPRPQPVDNPSGAIGGE